MGKKNKPKQKEGRQVRSKMGTGRFFLGIAIAAALYLAWVSFTGGTAAGCGPESSCSKVLQSKWSHWMGIPVSIPALLVYAGLFAASLKAAPASGGSNLLAVRAVAGLSLLVAGAAAWFLGVQALVIKSFCVFCVTAHVAGLIASLIFLSSLRARSAAPMPGVWAPSAAAALAGVGLLAAGPYIVPKKMFETGVIASGSTSTNATRTLPLHNGRFTLKLDELPVLGSKAAPHIVVSMFDYSCHVCRDLHHLIGGALQRFKGQVAFASLPVPLDGKCNHYIRQTSNAHIDACELARLSLAVWRARPEAWEHFDNAVFALPSPPPLDHVRSMAENFAGRDALQKALQDPWVARRIQEDTDIYAANGRAIQSSRMPQLIMDGSITAGAIETADQLAALIRKNFGINETPAAN